MKNIHVLPGDIHKPSRLYFKDGDYKLDTSSIAMDWFISSAGYKPHNIYITSDEEIKGDDWVLNIEENTIFKPTDAEVYDIKNSEAKYYEYCKKVILTTDGDLIADGVQVIDDEFLEWFVKNPSCEKVEVKKGKMRLNCDGEEIGFPNMSLHKIIIPKEEPKQEQKQHLIDLMKLDEEPKTKCYCGHTSHCDCVPLEEKRQNYFVELAKWIIENRRSVFEEADISIKSKRGILNSLGWSSGDY